MADLSDEKLLHNLRNPHGLSQEDIRIVRLQAANEIERLRKVYDDLRKMLPPLVYSAKKHQLFLMKINENFLLDRQCGSFEADS